MQTSKLLIIISAYNEESNIKRVINDIRANFSEKTDILVIDDGSTDKTIDAAEKSGVKVISLPFNLGIGAAIQTGLKYAKENDYDIVVRMDADGQHKADQIEKLIKPLTQLQEDVDMIIGSRFLDHSGYKISFPRFLGIILFDSIIHLLTGQKIKDVTSGFNAYNRKSIAFLSEFYPSGYPEPEVIIHLRKNGFKIKEVSCTMGLRKRGKSSIGFIRATSYIIKVILTLFINKWHMPIKGEE